MRLLAFQGLHYTSIAGDPGCLAAPPFDQIDDQLRDRLHRSDEHQFSHLTRSRPAEDGDPHKRAKELHDQWCREGMIAVDKEPSLYPYLIELAGGGHRLGLCALVGVAPSEADDLRPHEQTVEKPLADRLALLRTIGIDLEPVLLLAEDTGELDALLADDVGRGEALAAHTDPFTGDRHVLYRIADPERIRTYQETLDGRFGAIADGHHRTKVAQVYAAESGAPEGTATAAKMAVLTSLASEELRIDPIHRAVQVALDRARLTPLVAHTEPWRGDTGAALAAAVAAAPQPALGVWFAGGDPEIWQIDPDAFPSDAPGGDHPMSVVALHHLLLPAAGLGPDSAKDGSILYRSDPEELYQQVRQSQATVGFWLPPMTPAAFADATAASKLLPPKSTRFLPKLVSGLVWSSHEGAVS